MTKFKDSKFYRYFISAICHPKKFIFCLKYPFWKLKNSWTGKFIGYETTWYDYIEPGWQKAFGIKLSNDIVNALKEDKIPKRKWCKNVLFDDIKEKWGSLCLYCETTDKVQDVLDKYELLSMCYCINCGKPVRYKTSGWVNYLCEECFIDRYLSEHKNESFSMSLLEASLALCAVTEKLIPEIHKAKDGSFEVVDLNKEYGIDFENLWGLK